MKKILVIAAMLVAIIIGAAIGFINKSRSQLRDVQISISEKVPTKIFRQGGEHSEVSQETIASFNGSFNGKLEEGLYRIETQAASDFSGVTHLFNVGVDPTTISLTVNYSQQKLEALLEQEMSAIKTGFNETYRSLPGSYVIGKFQLFEKGQWLGGTLTSSDPARDTLRYVMHKKGQAWGLVTKPPQIVLSLPVFPDVPRSVLSAVNDL